MRARKILQHVEFTLQHKWNNLRSADDVHVISFFHTKPNQPDPVPLKTSNLSLYLNVAQFSLPLESRVRPSFSPPARQSYRLAAKSQRICYTIRDRGKVTTVAKCVLRISGEDAPRCSLVITMAFPLRVRGTRHAGPSWPLINAVIINESAAGCCFCLLLIRSPPTALTRTNASL